MRFQPHLRVYGAVATPGRIIGRISRLFGLYDEDSPHTLDRGKFSEARILLSGPV